VSKSGHACSRIGGGIGPKIDRRTGRRIGRGISRRTGRK